jgi:hypothetical protein
MSKEKEFTEEEEKLVIKANWKSEFPKQCIGQCKFFGIEIEQCMSCGWDDGYVPVSSNPYNKLA